MAFTALRFENETVTVVNIEHKELVFSFQKQTVIPLAEFEKERFWTPYKARIVYIPRHTNEDLVQLPRSIENTKSIHSLVLNRFRRDHTKKVAFKVFPSIGLGKKRHYSYIGLDELEIRQAISYFASDVRLSFLTVPHFALARIFSKTVHGKIIMGVYADATFLSFTVMHEGALRFSKQYNFKEKGLVDEDRETFMAQKCRLAYRLFCDETGLTPHCTVLALEERDACIVAATLHDEGAILASVNPYVLAPDCENEVFYNLFPLMGLSFVKESESFLPSTFKLKRRFNRLIQHSTQVLSLAIMTLIGFLGAMGWLVMMQNEALKTNMQEFRLDLVENNKNILSSSYLDYYLRYISLNKEIKKEDFIPFFNTIYPLFQGYTPHKILFHNTPSESVIAVSFPLTSPYKNVSRDIFTKHQEELSKKGIIIENSEKNGTIEYRFSQSKKGLK